MKLDFLQIKNKDDFMHWIKVNFSFPEYFGKNWDAFYECLKDFVQEDITIKVLNPNSVYSYDDYNTFKDIIADYNTNFDHTITLDE